MAEHAHTPSRPSPSIRTLDFTGMVNITDHRDADLLACIERFIEMNDAANAIMRRLRRLREGGQAQRRLLHQVADSYDERNRLFVLVCGTKAQTSLGVIAKLNACLDLYSGNLGGVIDLSREVIVEAIAMIERSHP